MIQLTGVTKKYSTQNGWRTVLDDVNFEMKSSDKVGFLGRNGAGKSTLIRLIGGVEHPTFGQITRTKSVSWPLAFGGAFQSTLTGMDNLKFIARIYGADIEYVKEFVINFAELGSYIYEPIKKYSSGMRARLAFALSMAIEFDCFLIDEVISVGDSRFHAKCQKELFEKRSDRGIILVSHEVHNIKEYCESVCVLHAGKLVHFKDIDEGYHYYNEHCNSSNFVSKSDSVSVIVDDKNHSIYEQDAANLIALIRLNMHEKNYTSANENIQLYELSFEKNIEYLELKSDIEYATGEYKEQINTNKEILRADPDNYWANFRIGDALFTLGEFDQARLFFEKAEKINEIAPFASEKIANLDIKQGHFESAVNRLERLIVMSPEFVLSWSTLIKFKMDMGEYDVCDFLLSLAKKFVPRQVHYILEEDESELLRLRLVRKEQSMASNSYNL